MTVVWKDPPTKKRSWAARLEPLVNKPGRWALVSESPTQGTARTVARRLNKRLYRVPHPEHVWEFEQRGVEVYARYVGKEKVSA